MKLKKRLISLFFSFAMVLGLGIGMAPQTALAASNSTVVLHASTGTTPTGVKVSVGDKINGYPVTKISGTDITVDLGKYNVSLDSFRIPLPEEIWEGVKMQYNPQTYVIAATAGAAHKTPGSSALLGNGKNSFYYYNLGKASGGSGEDSGSYLWYFELKFDANGGSGAPATLTHSSNSKYEKSYSFTIPNTVPTREGYDFLGWADTKNATSATRQPGGSCLVSQTVSGYNGGSVSKTLYAVWKEKTVVPVDCNVIYRFVSGTADKTLPEEVNALLPASTTVPAGSSVSAPALSKTEVAVSDGVWTFNGWTPEVYSNVTSTVTFTGTWTFTATPEPDNEPPVINATDRTLNVGDKFDPREGVTATDKEDVDLTDKIIIVKNDVDTSKPGVYDVTYEVTDSKQATTTKTIKVTVVAKGTDPVNPGGDDKDPANPSNPSTDNTDNTDKTTTTTDSNTPKTGDSSNLFLWAALLLAGAAGVTATKVYSKKKAVNK